MASPLCSSRERKTEITKACLQYQILTDLSHHISNGCILLPHTNTQGASNLPITQHCGWWHVAKIRQRAFLGFKCKHNMETSISEGTVTPLPRPPLMLAAHA